MNPGDVRVSFNEKKVEGSLIYKRSPIMNFSDFSWADASFQLHVSNFLAGLENPIDWKKEFEAVSEAHQAGVFKIEWSGEIVTDDLMDLGS